MTPYLLLITHLIFADGKVSKVDQSYITIDISFTQKELAEGFNNQWPCSWQGEQLNEGIPENEAYVWQCVPAEAK